jgi:hypothetical protein
MPSHFTLRMQFGLHQNSDEISRQLLELVEQAPVDEIMFFFFAEELNEGHETLERIGEWIEHSRPYREALVRAGVKVCLNPWHSIMHSERGRTLKPGQNWQTMVDPTGSQAKAIICPLDPQWREYFETTLRLYAREDFHVIWIDDDIRLFGHSPLRWGGCFCPLHVAEFNRRNGLAATQEEIIAACTASGTPHPWRELWLDMWNATQTELVSRWRAIAEAGGKQLGLMSSDPEKHSAEGRRWNDWWRAIAGDQPVIHRPNYWWYRDMPGSELATSIARLDQYRTLHPPAVVPGPEIDCYPYGRWNKSFRQTGAQMALAHILGAATLNISLHDFMGNDVHSEPERAEFLREWRPVCDWLADEFPLGMRSYGIGIPWSENASRLIRTDGSDDWESLVCPSRGWASWLGACGHSFMMRPSDAINVLSGSQCWSFSDEELMKWLAQGVLLDGPAADILVQRGYGHLIGMQNSRFINQGDAVYSIEQCLDPDFSLKTGAQMSANRGGFTARWLQGDLLPGARIVSDLRGPTQVIKGHGEIIFENEQGGRVAIVPWDASKPVMMNTMRAAQISKTMHFLDPAHTYGLATGHPWLTTQLLIAHNDTNGRQRWRAIVWNASPDEVETFSLQLPAAMPTDCNAVQVTARGQFHDATLDGRTVRLSRPLNQWEFVAFVATS